MKDQRVESLLTRGDYKHEYISKLAFSHIDLVASADNPARIRRKIDDQRVLQYACEMLDGVEFPAIVVMRRENAKYLVGTGMHRIRAAQEAKVKDWLDAYVVTEPDQYRFDCLLRLLNTVEGRGDTLRDQLQHVISLHEQYGKHSLTELSKTFSLNKDTVLVAWREHQGLQRASRLQFDFERGQRQPQATIIALNQINSDTVYVRAAEYVVHYEPFARDVEDMVREIKEVRQKGEGAELEIVRRYHDEAEDKRRRDKKRIGKTSPTACNRMIGKCRAINNQVRRGGIEGLHLSALSDLDGALIVLEDLAENATKIIAEVRRIARLTKVT